MKMGRTGKIVITGCMVAWIITILIIIKFYETFWFYF